MTVRIKVTVDNGNRLLPFYENFVFGIIDNDFFTIRQRVEQRLEEEYGATLETHVWPEAYMDLVFKQESDAVMFMLRWS